jgi:medium-chain acyl-[acyl-carrier-protein] hydrolase
LDVPAKTDFTAFCDLVFAELAALIQAPFFLMGSSMGGWLAYEIARRFEAHSGRVPRGIITLGFPMPKAQQELPELDSPDTVAADIIGVNPIFGEVLKYPELLDMILPTMRADFRMCNAYRPDDANKVAIPILGFVGAEDIMVPSEAMRGWQAFTTAGFDLSVVPGVHDLHERPTAAMADQVNAFLIAAQDSLVRCDV